MLAASLRQPLRVRACWAGHRRGPQTRQNASDNCIRPEAGGHVLGTNPPQPEFARSAFQQIAQMENIAITPASPEELRSGELGRKLRHYNYGVVGEYPEQQYIRLSARDGNGRLLGGLRSFVFLRWLNIEVLFVEADVRGSGLGSRLLAEAERQAIELGARNAKLDTFEWQAPEFYRKHGYEEYARIDDYAPGFYLASMKKSLAR
ncbi:GNAT family N-acetyltransferase [Variovorax sp. S2]|uniref:GNAT family N-acetyltransferase n=2 Tax=unclassified Variovorax TaxID=663243 RepID=UPI00215C8F40|nr:GNAT family N-acetyltransferase [Variovorax sp. S12S4]MCR8960049.1 GNAT family N-acetyltransferase [Variovorax sp. S12S4]